MPFRSPSLARRLVDNVKYSPKLGQFTSGGFSKRYIMMVPRFVLQKLTDSKIKFFNQFRLMYPLHLLMFTNVASFCETHMISARFILGNPEVTANIYCKLCKLPKRIRKIPVLICGNFQVTQYSTKTGKLFA